MKKYLLYTVLMTIIVQVYGQPKQYIKIDYSGNASGNNIQMEIEHVFSAQNITSLEISIWQPFNYGHDNQHNSQTIQNFSVHPTPDHTYSDGNRKTYIYGDINAPNFTFRKTYNAETNVNLGAGFYSHDTYPVTSVPEEYLMATDSIQADNEDILMLALVLTMELSENRIHDAVTELAKFMRSEISYRAAGPQNAAYVLNKGSGNCRGQTNLMVAMLRSLGIPTRYVSGVVLNDEPFSLPSLPGNDPITIGDPNSMPGRHAIYEVYYPSIGQWVQGDPQHWVHFYHQNFIKGSDNPPDDINSIQVLYNATGEWTWQRTKTSTFGSITNNYQYVDFEVFTGSGIDDGNLLFSVYADDTPIGVGDYITIEDPPEGAPFPDNTYEFYLGDELSFYANFYSYSGNTYLVGCDWSIDLYHSEGEFELLSGYALEIWQPTTPYSIPDYEWARWPDSDEILGKVKVLCLLNDGDYVYDDHPIKLNDECIPEFFTNQNVWYNTTINHCHTVVRNVTVRGNFSPTLTINSEKVVIEDNVTVQNGAKLIINADNVRIDKNFEAELGSELVINPN